MFRVLILLFLLICTFIVQADTDIYAEYRYNDLTYIKNLQDNSLLKKGIYQVYADISPKLQKDKYISGKQINIDKDILLKTNQITSYTIDTNISIDSVNKLLFNYKNLNIKNKNRFFAFYNFSLECNDTNLTKISFAEQKKIYDITDLQLSINMQDARYIPKDKLYLLRRAFGLSFDDIWRTVKVSKADIVQRRFHQKIVQNTIIKIYTKKYIDITQVLLGINYSDELGIQEKKILSKDNIKVQKKDDLNVYILDFSKIFKRYFTYIPSENKSNKIQNKRVLYLNELQLFFKKFIKSDILKIEFLKLKNTTSNHNNYNLKIDTPNSFSHTMDLSRYNDQNGTCKIKNITVDFYNDKNDLLYINFQNITLMHNDLSFDQDYEKIDLPIFMVSDFNKLNKYFEKEKTDTNTLLWAKEKYYINFKNQEKQLNEKLEYQFYNLLQQEQYLRKNKGEHSLLKEKFKFNSNNSAFIFRQSVNIPLSKDDVFVSKYTFPPYVDLYIILNDKIILLKNNTFFKINSIYKNMHHIYNIAYMIKLNKNYIQKLDKKRVIIKDKYGISKKSHIDFKNISIDNFRIIEKKILKREINLDIPYIDKYSFKPISLKHAFTKDKNILAIADNRYIDILKSTNEDLCFNIPLSLKNILADRVKFTINVPNFITKYIDLNISLDNQNYSYRIFDSNTIVDLPIHEVNHISKITISLPTKYFTKKEIISINELFLHYKDLNLTLGSFISKKPLAILNTQKLKPIGNNISNDIVDGRVYLGKYLFSKSDEIRPLENPYFITDSIILIPDKNLSKREFLYLIKDVPIQTEQSSNILFKIFKILFYILIIYIIIKYKELLKRYIKFFLTSVIFILYKLIQNSISFIYYRRYDINNMLLYILFVGLSYLLISDKIQYVKYPLILFVLEFIGVIFYIKYKKYIKLNLSYLHKNILYNIIIFFAILFVVYSISNTAQFSNLKYYTLLCIPFVYMYIVTIIENIIYIINKSEKVTLYAMLNFSIALILYSLFIFSKGVDTNSFYISIAGIFVVISLGYFSQYLKPWIEKNYNTLGKQIFAQPGSIYFSWAILFLFLTAVFISINLEPIAEQFSIIVYYLLVWGTIKELIDLKKERQ